MPKRLSFFFLLAALLSVALLASCDDELTVGVDIADIPSYYFENSYLDNKVDSINEAIADCSVDCETFIWITDLHWEPDLNARKAPYLKGLLVGLRGSIFSRPSRFLQQMQPLY